MTKVGLRDLKNRLSEYIRHVRAGHAIQVTDRGQVVAELVPPRSATTSPARLGLADLARRGLISLGGPNRASLYRRMPKALKRGELQRLIDEEREER